VREDLIVCDANPLLSLAPHSERLGQILLDLREGSSWEIYVPSRIGHCDKVDVTAEALSLAYQARKGLVPVAAAYQQYSLALVTLRQSIDTSDDSLMAVALLAFFESLMSVYSTSHLSHRSGIEKILLARRLEGLCPTEFERAMVFEDWSYRNRAPIARGIPSPLDDPYWLDMDPPELLATSSAVLRLQKIVNQLLIRTPKLVSWVRALRGNARPCKPSRSTTMESAVELVCGLLQLEDEDAESEILHRVSVKETMNNLDRAIVRHSFSYQEFKDCDAAVAYWRARMDVLRLGLTICRLQRSSRASSLPLPLDEDDLKDGINRCLTNIFMSREYFLSHTIFGQLRMIGETSPSCWGALSCFDEWHGLEIAFVRSWILKRFNEMWSQWQGKLNPKAMDETSEVLVGGPLKGHLVKWHSNHPKAANTKGSHKDL
jgi:hypothetical protein